MFVSGGNDLLQDGMRVEISIVFSPIIAKDLRVVEEVQGKGNKKSVNTHKLRYVGLRSRSRSHLKSARIICT